jgi:hypothetical protein
MTKYPETLALHRSLQYVSRKNRKPKDAFLINELITGRLHESVDFSHVAHPWIIKLKTTWAVIDRPQIKHTYLIAMETLRRDLEATRSHWRIKWWSYVKPLGTERSPHALVALRHADPLTEYL